MKVSKERKRVVLREIAQWVVDNALRVENYRLAGVINNKLKETK